MNKYDVLLWLAEEKRWTVIDNKNNAIVAVATTYEQAECLANLRKNYYVQGLEVV